MKGVSQPCEARDIFIDIIARSIENGREAGITTASLNNLKCFLAEINRREVNK